MANAAGDAEGTVEANDEVVDDAAGDAEGTVETNDEVVDDDEVTGGTEEARKPSNWRTRWDVPSAKEREEHERTHMPFRSWCPSCVAGRGLDHRHVSKPPDEHDQRKEVCYDYCFLRNERGGNWILVLVSKDKASKLLCAHVVPNKGAGVDWVVEQCLRDLERMGYLGRVTLRADQEPALVDLLRSIGRLRHDGHTILELATVEDSKSNGFAERAVRSVEEMVRTLKVDLERRLEARVPIDSPALPWLVEHAVDLVNKLQVGSDGRTAYERLKLKRYHGEMYRFGEPVLARVTGKPVGGLVIERFVEAIWLGQRFHSGEHIIARESDGRVFRCTTVKQSTSKLTLELLSGIRGSPWEATGAIRVEATAKPTETVREERKEESTFIPRGTRIDRSVISQFGPTAGCRKCDAMMRGSSKLMQHSVECRKRFEDLMSKDESFKLRVEGVEGRRNRYFEGKLREEGEREKDPRPPKKSRMEEAASSSELPRPSTDEAISSDSVGHRRLRDQEDEDADARAVRQRLNMLIAVVHGEEEEETEGGDPGYMFNHWSVCEEPKVSSVDSLAVRKAKRAEMERFKKMKVYDVVRREEATRRWTSSTVGVRWVLTEKSYGMKARLVAQEFASTRIDRDTLFAGTPSLGAMRLLVSRIASGRSDGMLLMTADVKTAFLYAPMKRDLLIELPPEDPRAGSGEYVGYLKKAMYGTRDAPQQWNEFLSSVLIDHGFKESVLMPGVFWHSTRGIEMVVHVDDLLISGKRDALTWLQRQLSKSFELDHVILGPEPNDAKEVQYLGRTICWTDEGLTVEGDQKHVKSLRQILGMESCAAVATPVNEAEWEKGTFGDPCVGQLYESGPRRFICGKCILGEGHGQAYGEQYASSKACRTIYRWKSKSSDNIPMERAF